jgi:hypothetical protein
MALSNYSKEEKQTHVELWSESGLSKREYSVESGIQYKMFLNWASRFGTKASSSKVRVQADSFIPIEVDKLPESNINKGASTIEILYPNGIQLSCPVNIRVDQLKTILTIS